MPRFSANISTLFKEVPLLDRIEQARLYGFDAIEIQFPYELDPNDFAAALKDAKLPLALINCPAGDFTQGGQGNAAVPGLQPAFKEALALLEHYLEFIQPANVNILAGRPDSAIPIEDSLKVFAENLSVALDKKLSPKLVIEAINTVDKPGFLLPDTDRLLALLKTLDDKYAGQILMQYDFYHMHVMQRNISSDLTNFINQIGHVQFADAPGRQEPGTGEVNLSALFQQLDSLGYEGYIGAEYFPSGRTDESLQWLTISK